MKKTTAQFKDNEKSTEALTKKGDILQRTLLTQKEKVEELQKALENAKKEYGEADKRTMNWEKSLNEAEAAVANTEHAIEENNEALEESKNKFEGFQKIGTAAAAAVAAGFAALVKTYKELISIATEAAANADNVLTIAQITGLDTDSVQEFQYAAELIDVSLETIESSLTKLKNGMQDAAGGNGNIAETFSQIGVSVTEADGSLRNAEDVFNEVIDALGEIGNETERDAVAMDVFGKKAEDLNPIIKQGSKTLNEYKKEAHDVGAVLSTEQLAALGAVDDAYQRLKKTQESVKNQIGAEMAPAVENFYSAWTDWMKQAGQSMQSSGVIEGLNAILDAVIKLLPNAEEMEEIFPKIGDALKGFADRLGIAKIALDDIRNTFEVLKNLNLPGILSGGLRDAIKNYASDHVSNVDNYKYATGGWSYNSETGLYEGNYFNAPGDYNFIGGRTTIGENGPETLFLPAGSQIMNAQDTRNSGGDIINVTIDARSVQDFNDIIRIAKSAKTRQRMMG